MGLDMKMLITSATVFLMICTACSTRKTLEQNQAANVTHAAGLTIKMDDTIFLDASLLNIQLPQDNATPTAENAAVGKEAGRTLIPIYVRHTEQKETIQDTTNTTFKQTIDVSKEKPAKSYAAQWRACILYVVIGIFLIGLFFYLLRHS